MQRGRCSGGALRGGWVVVVSGVRGGSRTRTSRGCGRGRKGVEHRRADDARWAGKAPGACFQHEGGAAGTEVLLHAMLRGGGRCRTGQCASRGATAVGVEVVWPRLFVWGRTMVQRDKYLVCVVVHAVQCVDAGVGHCGDGARRLEPVAVARGGAGRTAGGTQVGQREQPGAMGVGCGAALRPCAHLALGPLLDEGLLSRLPCPPPAPSFL